MINDRVSLTPLYTPPLPLCATFMGPYGGRARDGDRFIKHPTACTLVVTNQLNWIVWARRCFSGLWCNQAIYVGQRPRAPPRQTNVAAYDRYGRNGPRDNVGPSSPSWSSTPLSLSLSSPVTDEPRCDTRKATPLNHRGPERHILPSPPSAAPPPPRNAPPPFLFSIPPKRKDGFSHSKD